MRRVTGVVVLAMVLTACGEAGLLDGVGERAQDAVLGDLSTTTTVVAITADGPVLRFRESAEVAWWNDGIPDQRIGESSYTRDIVWARARTRVIQASRAEIAAVLPGLEFPRLVAEDIGWVTSQLLFDVASAQLDPGTLAQFGLWATEPYTPDQAAVAVLRVGRPSEGALRGEVIPEVVAEGISLVWVDGEFRYELFCQSTLGDGYCLGMADSVVPFEELVPVVAG